MNITTLVFVSAEAVTTTLHSSKREALEQVASDSDLQIPADLDDEAAEDWLDARSATTFFIEDHTVKVDPVVVEIDAGCVNQVAAPFPFDVLVIDKDTDCSDEDDIVTLPDNSTATVEWNTAEIDAAYVDSIIALAEG